MNPINVRLDLFLLFMNINWKLPNNVYLLMRIQVEHSLFRDKSSLQVEAIQSIWKNIRHISKFDLTIYLSLGRDGEFW